MLQQVIDQIGHGLAGGKGVAVHGGQDKVHHLLAVLFVGLADAHLHPGELVVFQQVDDVAHTVVGAGGAVFADADAAGGQVGIVKNHDEALGGHRKGLHHVPDGLARQVHIGLGLHQQDRLARNAAHAVDRLALGFGEPAQTGLFGQQVQGDKAHVVAGHLILAAGVAQAADDVVHRLGLGYFLTSKNGKNSF